MGVSFSKARHLVHWLKQAVSNTSKDKPIEVGMRTVKVDVRNLRVLGIN